MIKYQINSCAKDSSFSESALDLALYDLYQLYNISFFVFLIKGCALTYDIRRHPLLHSVNSQINEQQNAATKILNSQLSYMKPENFKLHCTLYLWNQNQMKKEQWGKRVAVAPVVFSLSDAQRCINNCWKHSVHYARILVYLWSLCSKMQDQIKLYSGIFCEVNAVTVFKNHDYNFQSHYEKFRSALGTSEQVASNYRHNLTFPLVNQFKLCVHWLVSFLLLFA